MAEMVESLQSPLQKVGGWCGENHLNMNEQKSAIVHFRRRSRRSILCQYQFTINGNPIEIQSEFKYLGIVFEEHLDFYKMADVNNDKAVKAFSFIKNEWYNQVEMSPVIFKKVIQTCIFPIFDYGCPLWSLFIMRSLNESLNLQIGRFLSRGIQAAPNPSN